MPLDQVAEAEHYQRLARIAYDAMIELRFTLRPNFNATALGYNDPDHARLTIVKLAAKEMDKVSAEHLKRHPV